MNVTRDVITDLLPAYESGEASRDTRELVEEFLRNDPEFAATVRESSPLAAVSDHNLKQEEAMETLIRTKRLLRNRSIFIAIAIFFSLLPFSVLFHDGQYYWAWRELPAVSLAAVVVGILGWVAYGWTWYRVRTSGL